ncbi:MAG: hypothetical protein N2C14_00665 [Planctomycetales bacterium]
MQHIYESYAKRRSKEKADYDTIVTELKGMDPSLDAEALLEKLGITPAGNTGDITMPVWVYAGYAMLFASPIAGSAAFGTPALACTLHVAGWICLFAGYAWYVAIGNDIDPVWGRINAGLPFIGQVFFIFLHMEMDRPYRPLMFYFAAAVMFILGGLLGPDAVSGMWSYFPGRGSG